MSLDVKVFSADSAFSALSALNFLMNELTLIDSGKLGGLKPTFKIRNALLEH